MIVEIKRNIPETDYRASRVCRVLGNPTAYRVIKLLHKNRMTPGELAEVTGVSISTISDVLRNLRNIDLVRYEVKTNRHEYWLKDPSVLEVIFKLEKFVQTIRILG